MKRIYCKCKADITEMTNLDKREYRFRFWCTKCGKEVTKQKLQQVIDLIKENA